MIIIIMLHLIFVDFHTSNFPCLIIGGGEGEGGLIAGSNWGSNPLAGLQSILKIIVPLFSFTITHLHVRISQKYQQPPLSMVI